MYLMKIVMFIWVSSSWKITAIYHDSIQDLEEQLGYMAFAKNLLKNLIHNKIRVDHYIGTHKVLFTIYKSMNVLKLSKPLPYNSYHSHHVDMKPCMNGNLFSWIPLCSNLYLGRFFLFSIDVQYLTVQKEKIVHNFRI